MRWVSIFVAVTLATPAVAQGGFLEGTLEDALSGEGRVVEVEGFEGALSSTATMTQMTIADNDGVWLTLRDVELDWNRLALLRGRVEVNHLRAAEILIPRLPGAGESGPPSAEASGFSLPDLPVSVNVGEVLAGRVELGAPVIGLPTVLSLEGNLSLANGEGAGRISAERIDGAQAVFLIDGAYSNETEILSLAVEVNEGANGIVATLANLPGRPSLALGINGEGPVAEFGADLRLATAGEDRLTGRVQLSREGADGRDTGFVGELSGDISPLFLPDYQAFFGPDVALGVSGTQTSAGILSISSFGLEAAQLALNGAVTLDAGGLPLLIDVEGAIAAQDGTPVLLPAGGPPTRVGRADIDISYDREAGDLWQGEVAVTALDRMGFSAERLTLSGDGRIEAQPEARVTAELDLAAEALDFGDAATADALGEAVEGRVTIGWQAGAPLEISTLSLRGESYDLTGAARITFEETGPRIETELLAEAADLANFAGLAGRPLAGAVRADVGGVLSPAAGFIDLTLRGAGQGLSVGIVEVDRLLGEETSLDIAVRRDETGTYLDRLATLSPAAEIRAQANLSSEVSTAVVTARLIDTGIIAEGVPGPLDLNIDADGDGAVWTIALDLDGAALGSVADIVADMSGEVPRISGTAEIRADEIAPFSPRVGREVAGAVELAATGFVVADLSSFEAALEGTMTDLRTGVAEADALLTGPVAFSAEAVRTQDGYLLRRGDVSGEAIGLSARGRYGNDGSAGANAQITLPEPGRLAPGLPGPVSLDADVAGGPDVWEIVLDLDGAGSEGAADLEITLGENAPMVEGQISLAIADLAPFADLAGRTLGGSVSLMARGGVTTDLTAFDIDAEVGGEGLRTGVADVDALLAGTLTAVVDAARSGEVIEIAGARIATDAVEASGSGRVGQAANELVFEARLADIARYVPGVSGPATAGGRAAQQGGGDWSVDAEVAGPGGVSADVGGTVAADFGRLDVSVSGGAPLAIANRFIAPQAVVGDARFDVAVNGPPALESVSGRVRVEGARAVAPTAGVVLTGVNADVELGNAVADLTVRGGFEDGGALAVDGRVGLTGALPTALEVRLIGAGLSDPELYETIVNGTVRIDGALAGGASIGGALTLDETEVRIPSGAVGAAGSLPDLIHVGEPRDVRATRARAGLIQRPGEEGGGAAFPLDLRISAPGRIFVRGRGIEAELGGEILLRGTTAEIIPSGQFDLIRGRLDILGKRLTLDEGRASLQGDFDPVVRLEANTRSGDTNITIIVDGPASAPEILFTSEPELPEDEVVARLLFDRGIDNLSPLQAAQLASAVAMLAGGGEGGLVSRLRQNIGLDDLDVAGDGEGGTSVKAGKYISDNVYTDVTVDSEGTSVSINLDLSPSLTVRGTAEGDGGTGLGIFFERDY